MLCGCPVTSSSPSYRILRKLASMGIVWLLGHLSVAARGPGTSPRMAIINLTQLDSPNILNYFKGKNNY